MVQALVEEVEVVLNAFNGTGFYFVAFPQLEKRLFNLGELWRVAVDSAVVALFCSSAVVGILDRVGGIFLPAILMEVGFGGRSGLASRIVSRHFLFLVCYLIKTVARALT